MFFYTAGVSGVGASATVSDVDVYTGYAKAPTLSSGGSIAAQIYTKGTNSRVVAVVFTGASLTTTNVDDNRNKRQPCTS